MSLDHTWPWYEVVDGEELEQGDLLPGFPVTFPDSLATPGTETQDLSISPSDVIVMTQTCDIPKSAQQTILLALVSPYDELAHRYPDQAGTKRFRREAVEGNSIGYFLLKNEQGEIPLPWSLVSFRDIYVHPKLHVVQYAKGLGKRLRLRHPYKEHLSQSFARFMMRVGLPRTTHEFKEYNPAS